MLGLSANLNYYLFNGNVDLRKGIFRLCESIREEMSLDPSDASNVYMFMSRNRKVVKILHYERGFYVLYEKRPVMGRFKKPVFDEVSKCYRIQWSDMAYLTESIVVDQLHFKATFLTGKTIKGRRDKHAINMIKYDNDYYYIDATWGDLVLDDEEIINNNYLMFDSQTMKQMYDLDDHYKITKNDKHTYFKEEGLYFDLYQLNTLKAKINKNQRECYLQFSNEVYNDAKERLTKKGDAYRLIEGVDHIQYITNDQLKTIYLKW